MLKKFLSKNIQVLDQIETWREAIKIAAVPLVEDMSITHEYIISMIENVEKNGSYIVIAPGVAIPHSRPEHGVLKTGLSLLKLKKGVMFPEEKEVKIIFVLAANDNETHLELISELANLIMEEEQVAKLFLAKNEAEALECIN